MQMRGLAAMSSTRSMPEIDQLTLARAARRGDRAALAAVVERFGPAVHGLVARMLVGQPQRIDDTAQDAMVKVLDALPRFDPGGPARLSTWILTIATRTCIDRLRRPPRGEPLSPELPGSDSPEHAANQRERFERVTRAMAALPAEQRAVLILRAYHDMDTAEIAAALEIEVGTVKSRLSRARAALRRATGDEGRGR
jgi:RNA polymerase sigma-70 factor (ECF subfamily)